MKAHESSLYQLSILFAQIDCKNIKNVKLHHCRWLRLSLGSLPVEEEEESFINSQFPWKAPQTHLKELFTSLSLLHEWHVFEIIDRFKLSVDGAISNDLESSLQANRWQHLQFLNAALVENFQNGSDAILLSGFLRLQVVADDCIVELWLHFLLNDRLNVFDRLLDRTLHGNASTSPHWTILQRLIEIGIRQSTTDTLSGQRSHKFIIIVAGNGCETSSCLAENIVVFWLTLALHRSYRLAEDR